MFMTKRKIYLFTSVVLLAMTIFAAAGCDFLNWYRYKDEENRFSILLPRDWYMAEGVNNMDLYVYAPVQTDDQKINFTVKVTQLPANIPVETYFDANKEELLFIMPGASDLTEGQFMTTGFNRAHWMAFSARLRMKSGVEEVRFLSAVWVKGKRAFVISAIAPLENFPKYEPIFWKVMKSLRIS